MTETKPIVSIENVVASASVDQAIDLADVTKKFPDSKIFSTMLDIKNENSIIESVNKTNDYFKNINGLINATYGATGKALEELTAEEFNNANEINLTGSFLLSRHAITKMKKGGSIIMFASMYGIVSPKPHLYPEGINPNPIEYGAGKAGLIQLTKYLASHYGSKNIRVNAIAPGPFPDIKKNDNYNQEFLDNLRDSTMLKRLGESREIAGPIIFLLSKASS